MNDDHLKSASEHNLLDLFLVIVRKRKMVLSVIGAALVMGLIIAIFIPRQYKSVARVLPPKETGLLSGLSGINTLIRSLPGGLSRFGTFEDPYNYIAILKSRTVMEELITKLNLLQVYGISDRSMEKAIRQLKDNTEIDWTEENTLEIRVWDYDARRAAEIAQFYVEMLNKRSFELQTQEARNTRQFIEQRVHQNRGDLYKAEQALKAYQEKEKMIVPVNPEAAGISPFAELSALKTKKELERDILKGTVGKNHPEYIQIQREIDATNKKLATFPEIGIESLRLYRELAIQQKILELLVPLHEQAKVNENKDVPVAYLLDAPVPSERPDRPRRIYIVGIATFLGIVLSLILVGISEYKRHLQATAPEKWERIQELTRTFRFVNKSHGVSSYHPDR